MKSKESWEKRSYQKLLDNLKDADKMLNTLKSDYNKAINNINDEIAKLYGKFAIDNKLDINTAQEIIKGSEFKEWRMKMEEYLSGIAKGDEALLLELNVLSMRSRINRLEALEGEILANISIIANSQDMKAAEVLTKSLENTYYSNMYDHYKDKNNRVLELMEKHQVKLSNSNISAILDLPWSGNNCSKNIWKREYNVAHKVKSLVTQNILSGASIDRLSNVVAEELGKDYKIGATTLIRTEVAYVKGQGDLLTYEKLGVDEYEFLATLDSITSKICRSNDGKHFKVAEAVPGVNYPPMHSRCRSTTVAHRDDRSGTRAARDKDGKTYKVPASMTYNEWYDKYVITSS